MAIFNQSDLTFTGEEIRAASELIMENVIGDETELSAIHRIETGIVAAKKIGLVGTLGRIGKASQGCSPTADSNNAPIVEKTWDPKEVSYRDITCYQDWEDSFFVYGQKLGVDRPDLTSTEAMSYIQSLVTPAAQKAMWRIGWFSDTTHANVSDSPAGVITDGVDLGYYNILDGIWKQIYAIVAANSARRYEISENSEATYADQLNLAAGKSYTVFENLYRGADPRLITERGSLVYVVTKTLFDNYATYLESKSTDASFTRIEAGFDVLFFRGIPVISMPVFDDIIRDDFDNGTTYQYPHRAVLMNPDNVVYGLEETDSHIGLAVNYDPREKDVITDAQWKMDVKVLEDYKIQVAY